MDASDKERGDKYFLFLIWYFTIYFGDCVMGSYFVKYMQHFGLDPSAIGSVSAVGGLIPLVVQPIWAMRADKARYKNDVLLFSTAGAGAAVLLLLFRVPAQWVTLFIAAVYIFIQCFKAPSTMLTDTIALEYLEEKGRPFGSVRLMGSIGWSVAGLLAGALLDRSILYLVPLCVAATGVQIAVQVFLPRVRGHMKKRVSIISAIGSFFKNPKIAPLILAEGGFSFAMSLSGTFLLPYYENLGGTAASYGVFLFIMTLTEIPYLFFGDRIVRKLGTPNTLALVGSVSAARLLYLFFMPSWKWMFGLIFVQGMLILRIFAMTVYIGKSSPPELKTSAQMLHSTVSGAFRALGSFLGGILVKHVFAGSYSYNFLISAVIYAVAVALLLVYMYRMESALKKERENGRVGS